MRTILDQVDPNHASFYCWLWAFNIASINICTRGSSDSITNYLVLLSLRLILSVQRYKVVGLLIYLRVYPVIYLPAYIFHIMVLCMKSSTTEGKDQNMQVKFLSILWNTLLLIGFTTITLLSLMCISYCYYGHDYLKNAVLYHLSREDHRHNFSMHFYGIYLSKGSTMTYAVHLIKQLTQHLPSIARNVSTDLTVEQIEALVGTLLLYLPSVVLFLPQVILFAAIIVTFAPNNLPLCLLFQTMVFVSYNKVITAQYFS